MQDILNPDPHLSRRLRLSTLIRLRWLAIAGQLIAVVLVSQGFNFPFPVFNCFVLIALSAALNIVLSVRYQTGHRMSERASLAILAFDAIQLTALLYFTGGLTNPFSILITVPVIVSATSLPLRLTLWLGALAVALTTALMAFHFPLPWYNGVRLEMPFFYVVGMWIAILSSLSFSSVYAWRVADEARQLAAALTATELILQREQHLSALDGLAAAAAHELGTPLATISLVSREMERDIDPNSKMADDIALLRSQSQRCRDILRRLTSLSSEGEEHLARMPWTSLIEEIVAPNRYFGVDIVLVPMECEGGEPILRRNPGVMYGLGNLIENAVDFATDSVTIEWGWDENMVWLRLRDDGKGFPIDIIDKIGEPYMTTRSEKEPHSGSGGLGLGLFIAKTLLERSSATLSFSNSDKLGFGAQVFVKWPRSALEFQNESLN